jgi:hypothetical protein
MKIIKAFVCISLLSGCTLLDQSNIAPGYKEAYQSIRSLLSGNKDNEFITKDLISNIPYASAIVSIGKGQNALLILESVSANKEYTWVSSDGVYLVLKHGRIIKTAGLENNLINTVQPIKGFSDSMKYKETSYLKYLSYDMPELINLKVNVSLKFFKKEEIDLFSRTTYLDLFEEEIVNEYLGWKETNKYWVDDNFFVYKTIQYISPRLPPIYFEVTKKPAN